MKSIITYFVILMGVLLLYSCSTTEPIANQKNFISYQVPKCNKPSLSKTTNSDSCFTYSFDDTLKIDFCVTGNCCPDSNRFTTDYKIKSDTIFISVADTASDNCWCICNYTIHLELNGLEKEKYLFYCDYDNRYFSFEYREYVTKK